MAKKLRVLHIHHAMYTTSLLCKGFRELGHKADNLYYDYVKGSVNDQVTWGCSYSLKNDFWATPKAIAFFCWAIFRYDVFHFWGNPYIIPITYNFFNKHYPYDLYWLKRFKKKIVFNTVGCFPMIRPSVWKMQVDPEICFTCQTTQGDAYGVCSNNNTIRINRQMEYYSDLQFGIGLQLDYEKNAEYVFLPVDLERWNPFIEVPEEYKFKRKHENSLLIFHCVGSHTMGGNRGNIKGTVWLNQCIEELRNEGHNVELMHIESCPNEVIRFYQVQADIVVDQLLVGGGGQNSKECLAVGKPILTRMHDQQIETYTKSALPHDPIPFINTDKTNLKQNLLMLIENPELRAEYGKKSWEFAQKLLSPKESAKRHLEHYEQLYKN